VCRGPRRSGGDGPFVEKRERLNDTCPPSRHAVARHDAVRYGPRTTPASTSTQSSSTRPAMAGRSCPRAAAASTWPKVSAAVARSPGGRCLQHPRAPAAPPPRLPARRCRSPRPRAARGPLSTCSSPSAQQAAQPMLPELNRPTRFRPAVLRLSRSAPCLRPWRLHPGRDRARAAPRRPPGAGVRRRRVGGHPLCRGDGRGHGGDRRSDRSGHRRPAQRHLRQRARADHADPIGIRMGAFDGDPGIRPSVRQFVAGAAPWEPIPEDGSPRYPESRHTPR
jgi:hypothetical protein